MCVAFKRCLQTHTKHHSSTVMQVTFNVMRGGLSWLNEEFSCSSFAKNCKHVTIFFPENMSFIAKSIPLILSDVLSDVNEDFFFFFFFGYVLDGLYQVLPNSQDIFSTKSEHLLDY